MPDHLTPTATTSAPTTRPSGPATAGQTPGASPRDGVRGMNYEDGRNALSPDPQAAGIQPAQMSELEELRLEKLEIWELEQLAKDRRHHIRAAGVAELMARDEKARSRSRMLEGGGMAAAEWKPEALQRDPKKKYEKEFGEKKAEEPAAAASGEKKSWRDHIDKSFKFNPSMQISHFQILRGKVETRALSEKTTLKRERGVIESEDTTTYKYEDGGLEVGKRKGIRATAYKDMVTHKFSDKLSGMAAVTAGEAKADAGAALRLAKNQVKVTGSAGASVVPVGGMLRLTAVPKKFKLFGEDMSVNFRADLDAKVVAEAKGEVGFDVSGGEKPTCALKLGGSAFAGAKAGVTLRAFVKWDKKQSYMDEVKKYVYRVAPDFLVDKIGERAWDLSHRMFIGAPRWAGLFGFSGGVTGSAGAGAEAAADIGFSNGKVTVSGKLGATVGLGAGVNVKAEADVLEGMHFAALMLMRGSNAALDGIQGAAAWMKRKKDEVLDEIQKALDEAEEKGGFGGAMAGAAETVGRWVGVFD